MIINMIMGSHIVPLILYSLSVLFLIIRLITKEKRDFIISVFFILLGSSVVTFTISGSVLILFYLAIIISFVGDLLMAQWIKLTEHRTIDGVMAFGVAHILYIIAFNQLNLGGFVFRSDWWLLLLGIILAAVLFQLVGNNPELHWAIKLSNAVYAGIISLLVVFVLSFVINTSTPFLIGLVAFLGVVLFVISDGVLAYNEFQQPISHTKDIIAVTYVLAQIFLQLTPLLSFIVEL